MVQQENIHSGRSNSQLGSRSRCRRCNLTSLLIHALSRSGSNPATVNFKSGQVGSETGHCMSSEHFGPWFGNLREYLAHLV
jgi:hypothetical protein